jgi:hypothetical protein
VAEEGNRHKRGLQAGVAAIWDAASSEDIEYTLRLNMKRKRSEIGEAGPQA